MIELCVKCKKSYIPKKNSVVVEEIADFGSYQLWKGDLKECPRCHHEIVSGFAQDPFAEHYEENYKEILQKIKKEFLYKWKDN